MRPALCLAFLLALGAGCATAPPPPLSAAERLGRAQLVSSDWYIYSQLAALKLIEEYGPPDRIERNRLTWHNRGPWQKIVVWNARDYHAPAPEFLDSVEQTVPYTVPADKRTALAAFSGRIRVSRDGSELTARGADETLNLLALNLAHELIRGVRSPEEARRFYERTRELAAAGKSSPYMQELFFLKLSVRPTSPQP
ncbi:MAG: hypothetical protein HY926_10685 [Elusimicrobia bacterium]|nr:hypothetical protein [Elusimicrobiota bacterium]